MAGLLLLATMIAGCSTPGPALDEAERTARARMRRELGMVPPIRGFPGAAIDDGGTRSYTFVDSRGESLRVYQDNRLIRFRGGSEPRWQDGLLERKLCLYHYPEDPRALRLAFGSAAESAVVDLATWSWRSLLTPEHEALLDSEDAWVRATNLRGRIQLEEIAMRRTADESRGLALRALSMGIAARRDFVLSWSTRFTPGQKLERIRRELGLSPPYTLLGAGHAPDGGTGIAHFTDPHGHALWVFADATMYWPGIESGVPPPVRHVWVNSRQDRDTARQLEFSTPAESAVVDLMEFVLADEWSRRARTRPEDSRHQLRRIVGRIRQLPAEALETRAMFLESAERLQQFKRAG